MGKNGSGNKKIFVIPHFHYDLAWIRSERTYLKKAFKIIEKVLYLMDIYPKFKYLFDQSYYLEKLKSEKPNVFKKVKEKVEEGRIEIANGGYTMPDLNLLSPFTIKKSFLLAKEFAEKEFNFEPVTAWMIDCFGHHGLMPKIAKESGLKYYVFYRGMNKPNLSQDFIWEGSDGTKILTHWMKGGYSLFGGNFKSLKEAIKLLKPSTNLVLIPFGGDFYLPSKKLIEEVLKEKNAFFSTPKEFFSELEKFENKLPVVKGEHLGEYKNFYGVYSSRVRYKQLFRRVEKKLFQEKNKIEGWKILARAGFHDLICGTGKDSVYPPIIKELKELEKNLEKIEEKEKYVESKFPFKISILSQNDYGDLYHSRPRGRMKAYEKANFKVYQANNKFKIDIDLSINKFFKKVYFLIETDFKNCELLHHLDGFTFRRELNFNYPLTGWIEVWDKLKKEGLKISSMDCFEYKVDESGKIFLTLVRSTPILSYRDAAPFLICLKGLEFGKHKFEILVEMLKND